MEFFVLVFFITTVSIAGLAIGVILGRAPLRGTCASGTCTKVVKCSGCQHHHHDFLEETQ